MTDVAGRTRTSSWKRSTIRLSGCVVAAAVSALGSLFLSRPLTASLPRSAHPHHANLQTRALGIAIRHAP